MLSLKTVKINKTFSVNKRKRQTINPLNDACQSQGLSDEVGVGHMIRGPVGAVEGSFPAAGRKVARSFAVKLRCDNCLEN